ncbi:MAG: leucine-rich repeat domain-containing protein [Proteobacteria bacterium]|nr:leucine-rich repeat domain-containing protein [Pseudomonadota bacterium]
MECQGAISFPDTDLEAQIRDVIDKPTGDICYADVSSLTSLDLGFYHPTPEGAEGPAGNISDITGLQCFTHLEELCLSDNPIVDLGPIAELTNLTSLNLYLNLIVDIRPIAKLTNLTSLGLSKNQIVDIGPIAKLTNLTSLGLSKNQIVDIGPIAKLTNLTSIGLSKNQVVDIGPIAELTNLTFLNLDENQIVELEPLVLNTGLGTEETSLRIESNNYDCNNATTQSHIATLQSRNLGEFEHDCD